MLMNTVPNIPNTSNEHYLCDKILSASDRIMISNIRDV